MGVARRLRRRRSCGMAMVEMVFVLPVLLMIVFAIAEFGLMFSRWLTLSNAVREGARVAVVYRKPCDVPTVQQQTREQVKSYAAAGGVTLADTDITVTGACAPNNAPAVVIANYNFNFQVLPGFAPDVAPSIVLTYASTMRNE